MSTRHERATVRRASRTVANGRKVEETFTDTVVGELARARVRRLVRVALGCSLERAESLVKEYLV